MHYIFLILAILFAVAFIIFLPPSYRVGKITEVKFSKVTAVVTRHDDELSSDAIYKKKNWSWLTSQSLDKYPAGARICTSKSSRGLAKEIVLSDSEFDEIIRAAEKERLASDDSGIICGVALCFEYGNGKGIGVPFYVENGKVIGIGWESKSLFDLLIKHKVIPEPPSASEIKRKDDEFWAKVLKATAKEHDSNSNRKAQ